MTYKQIKWLILLLPTFSVGMWEYLRHSILEEYISMSSGNWVSAIIVFLVTLYFLNILFGKLEDMQQELQRERSEKAVLEERENIAKELHDGIAQSLFFLSVQVNKIEVDRESSNYQKLKKTLQHIHDDTRSAIQNLRTESVASDVTWTSSLHQFFNEIENTHSLSIHRDWEIDDHSLSTKEKIELFACVKEAIINVIKHADTDEIWVSARESKNGWFCEVLDKGKGFTATTASEGFGLKIVKDRAVSMGWDLEILSDQEKTAVRIKGETAA